MIASTAGAQAPLSAIDWLSKELRRPSPPVVAPVDGMAPAEDIGVVPLDAPKADGAGLVEAARAGLPADFWGVTPSAELVRLLALQPVDGLPAINALLQSILVAELDLPAGAGEALFLARIDKLIELGALDQALELSQQDPAPDPALFRRRFDLALLIGQEDGICDEMRAAPALAPGLAARVYCLARADKWGVAATTLDSATALGDIGPAEASILARFLEPELAEAEALLPPPSPLSPLDWRMLEAIGEPVSVQGQPLAFAQADLRANGAWRARIEAGERLARSGALDPNALRGLYTERAPAASGGVWDRARGVQDLEAALDEAEAGQSERLALMLPQTWQRLSEADLEVPLAEIYGARLAKLTLPDEAGMLVHRICLLVPGFVEEAARHQSKDPTDVFLKALALGNLRGVTPAGRLAGAIRDGFRDSAVPPDLQTMLAGNRRGEAVLQALLHLSGGGRGDLRGVTEGLATLRAAGLDRPARQIGIQLLLLDRRG